jgi:hypothetical protein
MLERGRASFGPRRRRFHPMTSAKKHHFVPQFLLKHFARAGTSQVHVFDTLNSEVSRPFPTPKSGRISVKVINHLGDEVTKVFRVE